MFSCMGSNSLFSILGIPWDCVRGDFFFPGNRGSEMLFFYTSFITNGFEINFFFLAKISLGLPKTETF